MKRLKNVLLLNAVSSGATGILLIMLSEFFADLFGITQTSPFVGVGIFLLLFALYVFFQSRKEPLESKNIRVIIALDILWVAGSLVIVFPQLFGLTFFGYLMIGGVALWVAVMAYLQTRGLKTLSY